MLVEGDSSVGDLDPCLDVVLDLDGARREYLGEFFGHVRVLDGFLKRRENLTGEFARAVDRAAARVLAEQVADVVDEVFAIGVFSIGSNSHDRDFAH